MDYVKRIFSCCCKNEGTTTVKINFTSSCCKSRTEQIIITNEDDIKK